MKSTILRAMSSGCWPPSANSCRSSVTTPKTAHAKDAGSVACFARERPRTQAGAGLQASSEQLVLAGEYLGDGVVGEDLANRFRQQIGGRDLGDHVRGSVGQRDRVGDDDS